MKRLTTALVAGAILCVLAASASAATFSITRARWDHEDRKLRIRGTGSGGATITVTNAQTGQLLGRPRVEDDGQWVLSVEKPATVPCRVQAAQGSATLQRTVDGAPSSCSSSSATLSSLAVTGPATVAEGATAKYVATATFTDGSRRDVTASATWSETSSYSTIAAGTLTASAVPSNQSLTVTAAYASGSISRTGSLPVTIQDAPPPAATLSSLAVTGPASVTEGTTASYTATATFSNGSTQNVTASAAWTENSGYASIAGGVLTTANVPSNQAVTVGASFTSGTITRSASLAVAVQDVPPAVTLSSLAVTGPASVTEGTTASYTATATFSNGTTQNVTASATWTEDSGYTTIAGGVLTATSVQSNQALTVGASFTSGTLTRSASLPVTVQDVPAGPPVTGSHAGRFMTYDGTATCLTCHRAEAMNFHQSTHYQWKGDASESTGLNAGLAGKLGGINDFCIYPDINWLGKLTTNKGAGPQVDGGCARCHTGKGLKPTPEITEVQLENIDCLLCHSPQYKRTLQQLPDGTYTFVADTAKMTVSLLQAASNIQLPGSDACLNCHTKAGGGNNFKRGDLEEAHRPATATVGLDVHMAPVAAGGAGLTCTSCHTTVGHRIAGRGVDMRQRDLANTPVTCTNCHPAAPHTDSNINKHTSRLACNVCHVPTFAKTAPTDMRRNWSLPGDLNATTGLYEPNMVLQANVTPVYRFFNGQSQFYEFGTPAVPGANGRVLMAGPKPTTTITDTGSKITAMKRHEGLQPIDPVTKWLLPLKIGLFFENGEVFRPDTEINAIQQGVAAVGWAWNGYGFQETERYMGLYHEVAPKAQALTCSTCHGGTRMDFTALGYTPLPTRNGVSLCASCHSSRNASFTTVHNVHVTQRRYDCSTCHTFSKAL